MSDDVTPGVEGSGWPGAGESFMDWLTRSLEPDDRAEIERKVDGLITHVGTEAVTCRTKTPEPHYAGEFPMTCYACHMVADS